MSSGEKEMKSRQEIKKQEENNTKFLIKAKFLGKQ